MVTYFIHFVNISGKYIFPRGSIFLKNFYKIYPKTDILWYNYYVNIQTKPFFSRGDFFIMIFACVLIILSILVSAYFVTSYFLFDTFTKRVKKCDFEDMDCVYLKRLGTYDDAVENGKKWLCEQNFEEVSIQSDDGLTLCGHFLYTPSSKGTIIFFHGYKSNPINDFLCSLPFYRSLGYNILLVDQRAHGNSGGKYITFGVCERYDCKKWCEYVYTRFGDGKEIVLGGISMGASTVLMASGLELPPTVTKIVADCGFTSPYEIMSHVSKARFHFPPFVFVPTINLFCKAFAKYSLKEYSSYDALEQNRVPVLFIHGKADWFVPPEMSQNNYNVCVSKKKIVFFDGASHGMSFFADTEKYKKTVSDFLAGN